MTKKQTLGRTKNLRTHARKRAKLAIVPYDENQFRPYAVRRSGLAVLLTFVLVFQLFWLGISSNILGTQADLTAESLLVATNQARQDNGKNPLVLNDKLMEASQKKAQNMFDEQYWEHVSPSNIKPWHWFDEAGYLYAEAGENLAKNFNTSQTTVSAWMASPTHRENLLKSAYQDAGFAVKHGLLNGEETTIIVALYGSLRPANGDSSSTEVASSTVDTQVSGMTRLGLAIQSLSPVVIASIVVLLIAGNIALLAHAYRDKLPAPLRKTWYRHHGIIKAIGLFAIAIAIFLAYTNIGQL